MTTPILPTKTALAAYTYSPASLQADSDVERFLSVTNNYDFVLQLIQAFRGGLGQTYDISSKTYTSSATSFVYISDADTISMLIQYLTGTVYGYNYTVKTLKIEGNAVLEDQTLSYTNSTLYGYDIAYGANAGKTCILVAWA